MQISKSWLPLLLCLLFSQESWAEFLWFQQQNLKSLEGKLDLSTINLAIGDGGNDLATSPGVRVVGSIFREVVLEVSDDNVSDPTYIASIERSYLSAIVRRLGTIAPPSGADSWYAWLEKGIRQGRGGTIEEAFINMKLGDFDMDFATWKAKTSELRSSLLKQTAQSAVKWNDVLEASRRMGRNAPALRKWCQEHGFFAGAAVQIQDYGRMLTLGDYLDPRVDRSGPTLEDFLDKAKTGKMMLVMDISGLGVTNRIAQDKWFQDGARLDQLALVAQPGNARIVQIQLLVEEIFKKRLGFVPSNKVAQGDTVAYSFSATDTTKLSALLVDVRSTGQVRAGLGAINADAIRDSFNNIERHFKDSGCDLLRAQVVGF